MVLLNSFNQDSVEIVILENINKQEEKNRQVIRAQSNFIDLLLNVRCAYMGNF